MTFNYFCLGTVCLFLFTSYVSAAVRYVNLNNPSPAWPYTSWTTAATNIQIAVDAANFGDSIIVTNGIYNSGGRNDSSTFPTFNRVYVYQQITIQSVNGPSSTIIQGYQVPGTTNGTTAVRCVRLGYGATLSGFTLTNGAVNTGQGGGIYCDGVGAVVSNCIIIGNCSGSGGGGGGFSGKYNNCIISGNTAYGDGGGVLSDSTSGSIFNNCLISGNYSSIGGGGVYNASSSVMNNCTIVANYGGGVVRGNLTNCIVYYNTSRSSSSDNASSTQPYNCCIADYSNTYNNLASPPGFINVYGDYRLAPWSPCLSNGIISAAFGNIDLAGNPRTANGTVAIGAYQYQQDLALPPVHFVCLTNAHPTAPFTNWMTAATNIQDAIDAADVHDLIIVSNGTYKIGGRQAYGFVTNRVKIDKPVTVQSLSGDKYTLIEGSATGTRCLYMANGAILLGFTLTNGGASFNGDDPTNQNGGGAWCESPLAILSNCVIVASSATNLGGGAYSGTLINCTITGNHAGSLGGGTFGSILSNCTITNNNSGVFGGGAAAGLLTNCLLIGNNSASGGAAYSNILTGCILKLNIANKVGGGALASLLYNCTILNNKSGMYGGGAATSLLYNCTILNNNGGMYGGGSTGGTLTNCILTQNNSISGGGACSNTLINCTLNNNWATRSGGAAFASTLTNCLLAGNSVTNGFGGGATFGLLAGCILTNNLAANGGGACSNILNGCRLAFNTATNNGGGAYCGALSDCVLSNNYAANSGGGAYLASLTNCILKQNGAYYYGGGAALGFCVNCLITNNTTSFAGGGIYSNTAINCILISNNFASYGSKLSRCIFSGNYGASYSDFLENCELYFNLYQIANSSVLNNCTVALNSANGFSSAFNATNSIFYGNVNNGHVNENLNGIYDHCCLSFNAPGNGNFTNNPFPSVSFSLTNFPFYLPTNSPCINAGNNSTVVSTIDFDGRPRIVGGTVDIGATEFQGANIEPFISWLSQNNLPNDGSADYADADDDGMNNWQEWIAGTNPTNALSVLQLASPIIVSNPNGVLLNWQSNTNRNYYLQRSSDLTGGFSAIQSNIVGQANATSFTDFTATNSASYFYRVGVQ